MKEEVAAVLFLYGFCLVLEVDEAALDLIPDREVVYVVESDKGVKGHNKYLEVYQRRQKDFL